MMANSENNESELMDSWEYVESDTEQDPFAESTQEEYCFECFPSAELEAGDKSYLLPGFAHENGAWRATHESMNPELKAASALEEIVMTAVLPFLPAKSLCRFKGVSKEWNEWINTPFFAYKQSFTFQIISGFFCQSTVDSSFISLNSRAYGVPCPNLKFLPETVRLRTSCNGLICCQSYLGDNSYYICNPVNKQWQMLPVPNLYHGVDTVLVLAFEPSAFNFAGKFELICAIPSLDEPMIRFHIFSSRSRTWRESDTVCCELKGSDLCGDGLYIEGFAYWETYTGEVLAFDLGYEEYGIFPLPSNRGAEGVLSEFRKELCYVLPRELEGGFCEIRIYGGMNMTLSHSISFPLGYSRDVCDNRKYLRALPCLSDDIFAVVNRGWLLSYDVRDKKARLIKVDSDKAGGRYVPYVNSLAPVQHHQLFTEIADPTAGSSWKVGPSHAQRI